MSASDRRVAIRIPRDRNLTDGPACWRQPVRPAVNVLPLVHQIRIRLHGNQVIGHRTETLDGLVAGHGQRQGNRVLREIPDPRGLNVEVLPLPAHQIPGKQCTNDAHCLLQHVVPGVDGRPPLADHMLVQALATSQSQCEAPVREDLDRRGFLRDHGRVVPDGRTSHIRHQPDSLGGMGNCSQHRPGVRRMPLLGQPRRVMITHHFEVEADFFGPNCMADQFFRAGLFGHQGIAESCHH